MEMQQIFFNLIRFYVKYFNFLEVIEKKVISANQENMENGKRIRIFRMKSISSPGYINRSVRIVFQNCNYVFFFVQ